MKAMLMSLVISVAFVGQANAIVKGMQAREAIQAEILRSGSKMKGDIQSQIATLREQINSYNDAKTDEERAAVKAKGTKMFADFMAANEPVIAARSKDLGIGQNELTTMLKAAPETLIVLGYLKLPAGDRDAKVSAELTTIIKKAAPLLDAKNSETNQALHKALVLVNSEIGGNYEKFRTELAKQLESGVTDLRKALSEAAREVLGKDATADQINKFLAELAKCKV